MIPKIIHYCWFGGLDKPEKVQKYIDGWKNILPGYQIIEWNEKNFSIDYCRYTEEAYQRRKYAFVSDVARLYALKTYGGVYLDTDVEILKDFTSELDASEIFSFESDTLLMTGFMAAQKDSQVINELLEAYLKMSFINKDGSNDLTANTVYVTECLKKYGLIINGKAQNIGDIHVFNYKTFGAFDADNSSFEITKNTYLVHHCMATWGTSSFKLQLAIKKFLASLLGGKPYRFLRKIVKRRTTKN